MPNEVLNIILERCKNKSEVMNERNYDRESNIHMKPNF